MGKKDADSMAAIAAGKEMPENIEEATAFLNRMIGQTETLNFFSQFSEVQAIMKLKQLKESGIYKNIIENDKKLTWARVCEKIGIPRRTADEKIVAISELAEDFLAVAASFIGGNFNKIKQLSHAQSGGSATFSGELIEYNGKSLKVSEANQDELNSFLEEIVKDSNEAKDNNEALERLVKGKEKLARGLSGKLAKFEKKAEELGLDVADEVFMEFMNDVRTGFDGWAAHCTVSHMEAEAEEMTPSKRASLLSTLRYMKIHANIMYEEAIDKYGHGLNESDKGWKQE